MFVSKEDALVFYGKIFPASRKDKKAYQWEIRNYDLDKFEERPDKLFKWDLKLYQYPNEFYKKDPYINIPSKHSTKIKVPKGKYVATNEEETSIKKSFINLEKKEILKHLPDWKSYYLTEKGFLIASKYFPEKITLNYEEFKKAIDDTFTENEKISLIPSDNITLQFTKERENLEKELELNLQKYYKKFTSDIIYSLCCNECKAKISKLQRDCGIEEVNALIVKLNKLSKTL